LIKTHGRLHAGIGPTHATGHAVILMVIANSRGPIACIVVLDRYSSAFAISVGVRSAFAVLSAAMRTGPHRIIRKLRKAIRRHHSKAESATYDSDGLRTVHNHEFMDDPEFCHALTARPATQH